MSRNSGTKMDRQSYMQETLNRRSLYLRAFRKGWIIPVAGILCAILTGLLYHSVLTRLAGQRQYQVESKFYIDFAFNDQTQKAYDYYNAATWDELLFTHPQIADTIREELPAGTTMEEADADTKAELISDIRLMTVTVTADTAEKAAGITDAVGSGVTAFGESAKEFEKITLLSASDPAPVIVKDRTANAALLGGLLGILLFGAGVWIYVLMDDRIYIPEDIAERIGVTVLGVQTRDGKGPEFLKEDLEKNRELLEQKDPEHPVMTLRWGRDRASGALHDVQQLRLRGKEPAGILITEADSRFLNRYYGHE